MDDHGGEPDIIGEIGTSLQLEILSKLPPVDLVRTSILSSYWRNTWKNLLSVLEVDDRTHYLDGIRYFPDNLHEREESKDEFLPARTNLFNTVQETVDSFFKENGNKQIVTLKLILTNCLHENGVRVDKVVSWIQKAMGPKLLHLYLHFHYYNLDHEFVLQPNIFSCINLSSLT